MASRSSSSLRAPSPVSSSRERTLRLDESSEDEESDPKSASASTTSGSKPAHASAPSRAEPAPPSSFPKLEADSPPSAGLSGRLAHFTRSAPILGSLGSLSLTGALRWLLWLAAVLFSIAGLALVLVGCMSGLMALGSVSSALTPILSDASAGAHSAALGVQDAALATSNLSGTAMHATGSFSNLSAGLRQTAVNLDSLSALSSFVSVLDFGSASASLRQSADELDAAAGGAQAAGSTGQSMSQNLGDLATRLEQVSSDLSAAQTRLSAMVLWAQIALLALSAALALLLSSVLSLALAYGPPKKN